MDYTVTIDTLSRISMPFMLLSVLAGFIAFCHAFVLIGDADANPRKTIMLTATSIICMAIWGAINIFDNETYSGQIEMGRATVTSITSDGFTQLDTGETIPTRDYAVGDTIILACLDLGEKACADSNTDVVILSNELTEAFNAKNTSGFGRISGSSLYLTQK